MEENPFSCTSIDNLNSPSRNNNQSEYVLMSAQKRLINDE